MELILLLTNINNPDLKCYNVASNISVTLLMRVTHHMLCYVMLCYMVICKAPLTGGYSEALSA